MAEENIRQLRDRAPFEIYDSILVYPGANNDDRGWFNSFAELADADRLSWFTGRSSRVGKHWTNIPFERRDYAFQIYRIGCEFIAPAPGRTYAAEVSDSLVMPQKWIRELPDYLALNFEIAGADQVYLAPASHFPGGSGQTGALADGTAVGLYQPGTQGDPHLSNRKALPEPIEVPAAGQFSISGRIGQILREFLSNYDACPGYSDFPGCGEGAEPVRQPNVYAIRITLEGARWLQLRGARSAP
jgi:hypothetical protein